MSSKTITKIGETFASAALSIRFPVNWVVKPTIYSHFVGGENITECSPTVRLLGKFNVRAILDYSVEGTESVEDINKTLEETLNSIKNAGKDSNISFAVFKPTAFTTSNVLEKVSLEAKLTDEEKKEAQNFRDRINTLCKTAYEADIPILIDAEDSWYQKFIDDTTEEMMQKYNKEKAVVFNTWQMYRHDRLDFLKESYKKAKTDGYFLGAKFVRGAYMEKERERATEKGYPSPINPDKESTDKCYNDALRFCAEHIDTISIFNGTHNEESSMLLTQLMKKNGIAKNDPRCWFSQLYGMSDHISFNLAEAGYNVAKYVPYGPVKHVLPYLFRRAEENTSTGKQASRELTFIMTERKRRKTQ